MRLTLPKIYIVLLAFFVMQSHASAQYCANGTVNQETCGCKCSGDKVTFSGYSCYCNTTELLNPNMLFSYNTYDATQNCSSFCKYGTYSYEWWCQTSYGASWDVTNCGCMCKSPKIKSGGKCVCPALDCASQGKTQDPTSCLCVCAASASTTCAQAFKTYNATNCSCGGCIAPRVLVNDVCECPAKPLNSTMNSSCVWSCNSGYTAFGGVCYKSSCIDKCPATMVDRQSCLNDCELQ